MGEHAAEETGFHSWRRLADERFIRLEDRVEAVAHTVHGNGEPGLDEQVRALSRDLRAVRKEMKGLITGARRLVLALVFAGLSALGALAWQVIVWAVGQGAAG